MADIKIRSSFLNVLNEAIQKMVINDTIQTFTPIIVEADGKFTSVLNTNDNFDPNKLGSGIETVDNEEELNQNETKTQLLNKAKDAMDRSLDASNEFQQILAKIKKLSQTTDYDTWVVNKEGNTATLNSKKARIFKQNNNLCLSHEGKIELFKSVAELHNWLKENNYPLPKNIEIHESTELKEGFDLYSKYKEYMSQEKSNTNTEHENREKNKLSSDEIEAYQVELKNNEKLFQQEISPLKLKLDDLMLQYQELPREHKVYSKLPKEIRELNQQIDKIRQKYQSKKNINDIITKLNAHNSSESRKRAYEMNKTYTLGKPEYDKAVLSQPKPSYPVHQYTTLKPIPKEECCATTGTIGTAVAYTANKNNLTEEDELFERTHHAMDVLGFGDRVGVPAGLRDLPERPQLNRAANDAIKYLVSIADDEKLLSKMRISPDSIAALRDQYKSYDTVQINSKNYNAILRDVIRQFTGETENHPSFDLITKKDELINNPEFWDTLEKRLEDYIGLVREKIQRKNPELQLPEKEYKYRFNRADIPKVERLGYNYAVYKQFLNDISELTRHKEFAVLEKLEDILRGKKPVKNEIPVKQPAKTDDDITNAIKMLKSKGLSAEEILNMLNSKSESVFTEAINTHGWLKKLFSESILTEDDTPADFAKGEPLQKQDAPATPDSDSTPDLDLSDDSDLNLGDLGLDGDTSSEYSKDFGDLDVSFGGVGGEDNLEAPIAPVEKREIIDVLVDDSDVTNIKVKVKNEETGEIEVLPLNKIDI